MVLALVGDCFDFVRSSRIEDYSHAGIVEGRSRCRIGRCAAVGGHRVVDGSAGGSGGQNHQLIGVECPISRLKLGSLHTDNERSRNRDGIRGHGQFAGRGIVHIVRDIVSANGLGDGHRTDIAIVTRKDNVHNIALVEGGIRSDFHVVFLDGQQTVVGCGVIGDFGSHQCARSQDDIINGAVGSRGTSFVENSHINVGISAQISGHLHPLTLGHILSLLGHYRIAPFRTIRRYFDTPISYSIVATCFRHIETELVRTSNLVGCNHRGTRFTVGRAVVCFHMRIDCTRLLARDIGERPVGISGQSLLEAYAHFGTLHGYRHGIGDNAGIRALHDVAVVIDHTGYIRRRSVRIAIRAGDECTAVVACRGVAVPLVGQRAAYVVAVIHLNGQRSCHIVLHISRTHGLGRDGRSRATGCGTGSLKGNRDAFDTASSAERDGNSLSRTFPILVVFHCPDISGMRSRPVATVSGESDGLDDITCRNGELHRVTAVHTCLGIINITITSRLCHCNTYIIL